MLKLKKLGSVELIDIGAITKGDTFDGVRVGIKHVGPGLAREWAMRLQAAQQRELKRVIELRKGSSPAEAPELYATKENGDLEFETADGQREAHALALDIVRDCISSVEGIEDYDGVTDVAKLVDLVDYLGLAELLLGPAMQVQSLKPAQSFLSGSSQSGT